ncbi:MAG: hypothetical protein PSN37_01950 [Alphaproteobacteria bacterium]|nr:hypothetical protein [Alphaproteobacteria bacterium]
MTDDQLDMIADAYFLFIIFIAVIACTKSIRLVRREKFSVSLATSLSGLIRFILSISIVYAIMYLDNSLKLWPKFGLDYSTHTALALAALISLISSIPSRSLGTLRCWVYIFQLIASFGTYAILMIYQEYHTPRDILSTALFVTPILFLVHFHRYKKPEIKNIIPRSF